MYRRLQRALRERVAAAGQEIEALTPADVRMEVPPRAELGDFATPAPLRIAKRRKLPPLEVAEAMRARLELPEGVMEAKVTGGYLNFHVDRAAYLRALFRGGPPDDLPGAAAGKVIVEHTNINPNKAAHIGHLRNAILGDTLVRVLRALGYRVEAQNYIDDTGVQVADVIVGFREVEGLALEQVSRIEGKFDYHCWDLYTRVGQLYETSEAHRALRSTYLKAIEEGRNEIADLATHVASRIVSRHLETMERIGVRYDLLAWEKHILGLRFWDAAFERLKQSGAVTLASEGRNQGCWVMSLEASEKFKDLEDPDKVIVRSDGTVTYVGKDIAYQLWKFGLLGRDFKYRAWKAYPDGRLLWTTAADGGAQSAPGAPAFGGAERVYNVIDVRQSYLQAIVSEGLKLLGYPEQAARSIHFAYEMVAMTPRCCEELGFALKPEEKGKAYIEMSGRKGRGVKADDLLDVLETRALAEVRQRNAEMPEPEAREAACRIATGAVRYFMLRFGRTKVVAFDFIEALAFEGETGAYLINAVVRAASIFGKLKDQEGFDEADLSDPDRAAAWLSGLEPGIPDDRWELIFFLSRLDEVLQSCVDSLELSLLGRHGFLAAQKFHAFYHRHKILGTPDSPDKRLNTAIAFLFRREMTRLLDLMGMEAPQRM